jgi:hypothetical protein
VCTAQICLVEGGTGEIRVIQAGSTKTGPAKVRTGQVGASEISAFEDPVPHECLGEGCTDESGSGGVAGGQPRTREIGVVEVRTYEPR